MSGELQIKNHLRILQKKMKMRIQSMSPLLLALCMPVLSTHVPVLADSPTGAKTAKPETSENLDARIDRMADRGIEFLRTRGQSDDGAFSGATGAAVTGLCVRAILEHRPASVKTDPVVKDALKYVEKMVQPDGGIYEVGSKHRNYETSASVLALVAANNADDESGKDGHRKYDSILSRAEAFLKDIQWDEGEGITPADPAYGGAGYGSHSRPDLSNTSFMLDALVELGNDADDEAIQKALRFVARTQNLKAPKGVEDVNDTPHADEVDDGGFYYTPAAGGQSQAGDAAGGGLRSYGSMTYAGLKSMIYAGLTPDDPRVEAALGFIRRNYALDTNPGMGPSGLYYYYHTFAKSLDVAGIEVIDTEGGTVHDWREDLVNTLEAAQQEDGSWVNRESDRWMEGDRQLVTAYCLLALAHAKK